MSTDNPAHHGVMHKAVIAQAAILDADYTNDEPQGAMAQEEIGRLAKIDSSATNGLRLTAVQWIYTCCNGNGSHDGGKFSTDSRLPR